MILAGLDARWHRGQPQAHTGNCLLSFNLCSSVPSSLQTQPALVVWAEPSSGEADWEQTESRGMLGTQEPALLRGQGTM